MSDPIKSVADKERACLQEVKALINKAHQEIDYRKSSPTPPGIVSDVEVRFIADISASRFKECMARQPSRKGR